MDASRVYRAVAAVGMLCKELVLGDVHREVPAVERGLRVLEQRVVLADNTESIFDLHLQIHKDAGCRAAAARAGGDGLASSAWTYLAG